MTDKEIEKEVNQELVEHTQNLLIKSMSENRKFLDAMTTKVSAILLAAMLFFVSRNHQYINSFSNAKVLKIAIMFSSIGFAATLIFNLAAAGLAIQQSREALERISKPEHFLEIIKKTSISVEGLNKAYEFCFYLALVSIVITLILILQ